MAAAGTDQRFRIEISAAGVMNLFIDKVFKTNLRNRLGDMNRCEGKEPLYLLDWIDKL